MVFRDWEPAAEYFTDSHDVAAGFYRPCMRDAIRFDRITGFFSSAVYLIVWAEIVDFAARGGRIRIICSPALSTSDATSIADAYRALTSDELAESLLAEYHRLLQNPYLAEPAKALAGLIVDGVVDIRIAQVSPHARASSKSMFHDKTGLFFDDNDDAIGFRGGINETYLGFAVGGNVDSITVWTSWAGGRETDLISSNVKRFERLWRDEAQGVDVHEVPDIALEEFSRTAEESDPWQIKAEALAAQAHIAHQPAPATRLTLRPHQQRAIAAWETAGRIGLLKHATGSGKTVTAIEAIRRRATRRTPPRCSCPKCHSARPMDERASSPFERPRRAGTPLRRRPQRMERSAGSLARTNGGRTGSLLAPSRQRPRTSSLVNCRRRLAGCSLSSTKSTGSVHQRRCGCSRLQQWPGWV